MFQCKQCFIEFDAPLKCEGFCSWFCAFHNYHFSEKSKQSANIKKWLRLNDLMREEKESDIWQNKIDTSKKLAKHFNTMKNKDLGLLIQKNYKSVSNEKTYNTRLYETFNYCTCKGFNYRGECKHVQDLNKFYKLLTQ